jgi:hypothetical protein
MPSSVDFSLESPATVEEVHSAFADEGYWLARLAVFGGGRLDSFTVGADGEVTVAIINDLRHDGLPSPIAKPYPRDLYVAHSETWSPTPSGQLRGAISIVAHGTPGSGRGQALLTPLPNGSRLTFTATVKFAVPLVGGKIERFIAGDVVNGIAATQDFTAAWVKENA